MQQDVLLYLNRHMTRIITWCTCSLHLGTPCRYHLEYSPSSYIENEETTSQLPRCRILYSAQLTVEQNQPADIEYGPNMSLLKPSILHSSEDLARCLSSRGKSARSYSSSSLGKESPCMLYHQVQRGQPGVRRPPLVQRFCVCASSVGRASRYEASGGSVSE